ncbi:MAG: hypothetical protein ABIA93_01930 [Candidatus Woesearchaeota archaeon]
MRATVLIIAGILVLAVLGSIAPQDSPTGNAVRGVTCENPAGCIDCNVDSDCGTGRFTNAYYCQGGNVYGDYLKPKCLIFNSEIHTCTEEKVSQLVDVCQEYQYCENGKQSCTYKGGCLDINDDGIVNLGDGILMTALSMSNTTRNMTGYTTYADFDDNGIINKADNNCFAPGFAYGRQEACPEDSFVCITCEDGLKNGNETGIDCGGPLCGDCPLGQGCIGNGDCAAGLCVQNICQEPFSCSDNRTNGHETALDCGGPDCEACEVNATCIVGSDCLTSVCLNGFCGLPVVSAPILHVDPVIDPEGDVVYIQASAASADGIAYILVEMTGPSGVNVTNQTCNDEQRCDWTYVTELPENRDYTFKVTAYSVKNAASSRVVELRNKQITLQVQTEGPTPEVTQTAIDKECSVNADCGFDSYNTYCKGGVTGSVWGKLSTNRCIYGEDALSSQCVLNEEDTKLADCAFDEHCSEGQCYADLPELSVADIILDPSQNLKEQDQSALYVRVRNEGYEAADYAVEYSVAYAGSVVKGTIVRNVPSRIKADGSIAPEDLEFLLDYVFEQPGTYTITAEVSAEQDTEWRDSKILSKTVEIRKGRKVCLQRALGVLWCEETVIR